MVVSFGERHGALLWRQETSCPYPVLLDGSRQLYKLLGFKKSVSRVYCVKTLAYYADQKAAGRAFPKPYEDVVDDPYQMGGNIVLDKDGKIVFVYRSKTASDRPSITALLQHCV